MTDENNKNIIYHDDEYTTTAITAKTGNVATTPTPNTNRPSHDGIDDDERPTNGNKVISDNSVICKEDHGDELLRPFEWLTSSNSLKPHILRTFESIQSQQQQQQPQSSNDDDNGTTKSNNKVLHLGCGSSLLGEHLLEDVDYNISYVLNIDYDQDILDRMQQRWEKKVQNHYNNNNNGLDLSHEKVLDFQKCELSDQTTKIIADDNTFDLIIDKSTLDCLLCSPNEAVTAFITEVYRLMKSNGGVYICITFHSVQLMIPLLENIPGAQWDVSYEIIPRQSENLNDYILQTSSDRNNSNNNNNKTPIQSNDPNLVENDSEFLDDKFKTVKIITCRRRTSANTTAPSYLDWDEVCDHVQRTTNEWFQQENPFVTEERIQEIYRIFQQNDLLLLSLRDVYDQCFTSNEKEHYYYDDDFVVDWESFCKNNEKLSKSNNIAGNDDPYPRQMNAETFLLFLKEMQ